jgi:hypothetical protein
LFRHLRSRAAGKCPELVATLLRYYKKMLEICFDANPYAKLHELKITSNLNIGNIIRFPDFISVGDINPFLITNRNKMLSDFDISDFKDYQCNWNLFYQEIKKENGFRFWISK